MRLGLQQRCPSGHEMSAARLLIQSLTFLLAKNSSSPVGKKQKCWQVTDRKCFHGASIFPFWSDFDTTVVQQSTVSDRVLRADDLQNQALAICIGHHKYKGETETEREREGGGGGGQCGRKIRQDIDCVKERNFQVCRSNRKFNGPHARLLIDFDSTTLTWQCHA